MSRYFEIIITGRQLAWLVAAVVLLIGLAFGLGVAVRWFEPEATREFIAAPPLAASPVPTAGTPAAAPSAAPTAAAPAAPTAAPSNPPASPSTVGVTPSATVAAKSPPAGATRAAALPASAAAVVPSATPAPLGIVAAGKPVGRWVQVTAVSHRDLADGVRTRVIALGFAPEQVQVQPAPAGKFRVRLGPFPDGESAGRVAARLQAQGFAGAFVVKAGD